MKLSQRGGFVMGLVVGLLIGLAVALGVALYITKAPIPFINKVPQRTADQDTAEAERNRNWDPNAPLGGKPVARPASAASGALAAASGVVAPAPAAVAAVPAPGATPAAASSPRPGAKDPAAILAGGATGAAPAAATKPQAPAATPAPPAADAFVFFVQAGAYTRAEDAEQQRARLGLIGQVAKVTEREQAGRTVYRVRLGPYPAREEADALQTRLQEQGIEAQIVRVERP
ncbi:MAG: SPOR domain-containing protein [Rubrivivax sp.]|jgi:cell division protein FtsN|nr:SPOR domain-containing protein [Rubrivivax sp.]